MFPTTFLAYAFLYRGFKFEMSIYAQQTEVRKARAVAGSSSSSVEAAKKKRKAEIEESKEVEIKVEE